MLLVLSVELKGFFTCAPQRLCVAIRRFEGE